MSSSIESSAGERLRILGAEEGHDYLADVFDPSRKAYAHFDAKPAVGGLTGKGITAAIVDTGLLSHHPDIAARLARSEDFTREGTEDEHGHGTVVALLLLSDAPDTALVSVKVLGQDGTAEASALERALRWLESQDDIAVVNISAGVTHPLCVGNCSLCRAARRLSARGKQIAVAAGNLPGITACPAKASDAVFVVTALDRTGRLASYASPATKKGFAEPEGHVRVTWG